MTVGWGIVGIGRHADRYMAPAIATAENARLVAVYSRDETRGEEFGTRHGAERSYSDLNRMLADPEVEIIYVGSPSHIHAEQVIAAAKSGTHVLCDKPLATTVEDGLAIIEAAETNKIILATGYNQRYQAAHELIYNKLRAGEFGNTVMARAECSSWVPKHRLLEMRKNMTGAGVLLAAGTHVIDLLRWWIDSEVEDLVAFTDSGAEQRPEETAVAILKFANGTIAQFDSSFRLPWAENDLALNADHGSIRTEGTIIFDTGGKVHLNHRGNRETHEFAAQPGGRTVFTNEIEHLSTIVRDGGEPRANGLDGLEGVRIATAIKEAGATGKTVTIRR